MTITFEQLPFVYQVETLVHVPWYGATGIQIPHTYQILENDLKQEALRIWQEEKYNQDNVLKNLTPENERRDGVVVLLKRLLNYKQTSQFGDGMDERYRWDAKATMNDIYQKQLDKTKQLEQKTQNLNELFTLIFPARPYDFNQLKQEITRLKYQELVPQVREEKAKFKQLVTAAKDKADEGSFAPIIDLLLETQKQITEQENDNTFTQGQLAAYQTILQTKLTPEEIKTLLNKQTEMPRF